MLWLLAGVVVFGGFGIGAIMGAPYLPVFSRDMQMMLDMVDLKSGQTVVDLGCGDGRLLKAAAKRGIKAVGYEINPLLYLLSRVNCWPYRGLVQVHCQNFWSVKLPPTDVIYVFLIDRYMAKLDQKLKNELTQPTKLVSYVFAISDREPIKRSRNAAVYLYP